jgi:GNAT superfamily N-acetyltransferase
VTPHFERGISCIIGSDSNTSPVLDLIATLPEFQGRGFGSAVLKWGTEKADAAQSRIFLEATPEGVPVYLKHGWKILEEVTMDYTPFESEGSETFYLMMRDPVPQ